MFVLGEWIINLVFLLVGILLLINGIKDEGYNSFLAGIAIIFVFVVVPLFLIIFI